MYQHLIYTLTELCKLLNTKQDEIGLFKDNTKLQLLSTSNVLKSLSAGSNIVLTSDATNNDVVDIRRLIVVLHTDSS